MIHHDAPICTISQLPGLPWIAIGGKSTTSPLGSWEERDVLLHWALGWTISQTIPPRKTKATASQRIWKQDATSGASGKMWKDMEHQAQENCDPNIVHTTVDTKQLAWNRLERRTMQTKARYVLRNNQNSKCSSLFSSQQQQHGAWVKIRYPRYSTIGWLIYWYSG
jgi:hypothetical protein